MNLQSDNWTINPTQIEVFKSITEHYIWLIATLQPKFFLL